MAPARRAGAAGRGGPNLGATPKTACDYVMRPVLFRGAPGLLGAAARRTAGGGLYTRRIAPLAVQHGMPAMPPCTNACDEERRRAALIMPRYPDSISSGSTLRVIDYVGTVAFSLTGGVTAMAAGMDILGVSLVGTITAIGGGTLRDSIFLGRRPFWTTETEYVALCIATAVFIFGLLDGEVFTQKDVESSDLVRWGDAIGVAAFTIGAPTHPRPPSPTTPPSTCHVPACAAIEPRARASVGANNAIALGLPASVCVLCGMGTATFGGVVRDVLCQAPPPLPSRRRRPRRFRLSQPIVWQRRPRIFYSHDEIYATCAFIGASLYTLSLPRLPSVLALGGSVGVTLLARWLAWSFDLKLPALRLPAAPPSSDKPSRPWDYGMGVPPLSAPKRAD